MGSSISKFKEQIRFGMYTWCVTSESKAIIYFEMPIELFKRPTLIDSSKSRYEGHENSKCKETFQSNRAERVNSKINNS